MATIHLAEKRMKDALHLRVPRRRVQAGHIGLHLRIQPRMGSAIVRAGRLTLRRHSQKGWFSEGRADIGVTAQYPGIARGVEEWRRSGRWPKRLFHRRHLDRLPYSFLPPKDRN